MDNFDNMQLILDIVDLNNALPPPQRRTMAQEWIKAAKTTYKCYYKVLYIKLEVFWVAESISGVKIDFKALWPEGWYADGPAITIKVGRLIKYYTAYIKINVYRAIKLIFNDKMIFIPLWRVC